MFSGAAGCLSLVDWVEVGAATVKKKKRKNKTHEDRFQLM